MSVATVSMRGITSRKSRVPVPTSIQSSLGSTNGASTNSVVSNSSIQYKDIQLRLEVLPLINSDKDVSLEIYHSILFGHLGFGLVFRLVR